MKRANLCSQKRKREKTNRLKMSDGLCSRRQQQLVLSESVDLDGVIDEILSRLPAKSLLRFRCVCKAWRALISDPYFIRKHLSCINTNISTSYSLLIKDEECFRSAECEAILKCLSPDNHVSTRRLDFPVLDPPIDVSKIDIIGSCNGLICLLLDFDSKDCFMLWNPCTGEYHALPKPPFHPSYEFFWGFGYDSTTDDYKLLLGSYYSGNEFVLVFTLRTGSWRKLEGVNSYFREDTMGYCKGCLVNEALHWVLDERDDVGFFASKIVSFDLAEGKFHEIPFPYPPNPVDRREWHEVNAAVGILDNCLTLGFQSVNALAGRNLKMWVMKDYGVKESWTEVVNIPSGVIAGGYKCISQNGEALIRLENRRPWGLVMCNPKEKTFKILFGLDDTATYVESLVSPLMGRTNGSSL